MQNQEVGYIKTVYNYLVKIEGLPKARINELIETESGQKGVIMGLSKDFTDVLMLDPTGLKGGELVHRTGSSFSIGVGPYLLGRTINTMGTPIDGKTNFPPDQKQMEIFREGPGIPYRERIKEPFYTGIAAVDLLVPLGKGQRELVIGDAKSGKTFFLLQAILNQKLRNTVCVYAGVGKSEIEIKEISEFLEKNGALFNTVMVSASTASSPTLIYYAPYTAMTVAEYFQQQGRDVLIVVDDLSSHAKFTREINLLAERMPGRESYPGDIFYTHSQLVERAGRFNASYNGGSITALPVVETKYQDLTSFIPTTLMAMTDGHIYFNSELFYRGQRPPVDVSLSVSRVGNQTQNKLLRDLAQKIKGTLAKYVQLQNLTRFGTDISDETKLSITLGQLIEEFLRQEEGEILAIEAQAFLLSLIFTSFAEKKDRLYLRKNRKKLLFALSHDSKLRGFTEEIFKLEKFDEYLAKVETMVPTANQICDTEEKVPQV